MNLRKTWLDCSTNYNSVIHYIIIYLEAMRTTSVISTKLYLNYCKDMGDCFKISRSNVKLQGSQSGWTKNPYRRCEEAIMEEFGIWPYHSTMNSFELSYPYHIFIVFQHKKLTFGSFLGCLETSCLLMASFYRRRWVIISKIRTTRQKSKWVKENPYLTWNPSFCPYTSWKSEQ